MLGLAIVPKTISIMDVLVHLQYEDYRTLLVGFSCWGAIGPDDLQRLRHLAVFQPNHKSALTAAKKPASGRNACHPEFSRRQGVRNIVIISIANNGNYQFHFISPRSVQFPG